MGVVVVDGSLRGLGVRLMGIVNDGVGLVIRVKNEVNLLRFDCY
jgi:hypothetical protein